MKLTIINDEHKFNDFLLINVKLVIHDKLRFF